MLPLEQIEKMKCCANCGYLQKASTYYCGRPHASGLDEDLTEVCHMWVLREDREVK